MDQSVGGREPSEVGHSLQVPDDDAWLHTKQKYGAVTMCLSSVDASLCEDDAKSAFAGCGHAAAMALGSNVPTATNSLNHLAGKRKQLAHTASFAAFTGRALTIFRAGLALNTVGSFVNGLMPARSFVAGFLMTTNFAKPGNKNAPFFFNSL
jgi:hypothetical protein